MWTCKIIKKTFCQQVFWRVLVFALVYTTSCRFCKCTAHAWIWYNNKKRLSKLMMQGHVMQWVSNVLFVPPIFFAIKTEIDDKSVYHLILEQFQFGFVYYLQEISLIINPWTWNWMFVCVYKQLLKILTDMVWGVMKCFGIEIFVPIYPFIIFTCQRSISQ
jgi:hypothetical protein